MIDGRVIPFQQDLSTSTKVSQQAPARSSACAPKVPPMRSASERAMARPKPELSCERMGGTLEAHAEDRDDACWLTFELVLRSC